MPPPFRGLGDPSEVNGSSKRTFWRPAWLLEGGGEAEGGIAVFFLAGARTLATAGVAVSGPPSTSFIASIFRMCRRYRKNEIRVMIPMPTPTAKIPSMIHESSIRSCSSILGLEKAYVVSSSSLLLAADSVSSAEGDVGVAIPIAWTSVWLLRYVSKNNVEESGRVSQYQRDKYGECENERIHDD